MEMVQTRPRQEERLRMSYEEFLAWSDEDTHAEWEDGEVIVFMPPITVHQTVSNFLETLLTIFVRFFKLGEVIPAPYEMKITPDGNGREPDIIFVAAENASRITEKKLEGPADLIIEIVSNDSVARDRTTKFYEYQEGGVQEYWVIDPRPGKERADFWVLDNNGKYRPVPPNTDDVYESTVIPGLWLDINWLEANNRPDPLLAFAEIADLPTAIIDTLKQLAEKGPKR